ncbi:MAG: RNA polymerase sigma factor [Dysgonamonadaceae bacterium]|jgi:RNA polymerase sigma-70 factor (ECF subfamily)|nr:RNA polymerase sigma factor [Dysgonamonadaceae bacterium]
MNSDSDKAFFTATILPLKLKLFRQAMSITGSVQESEDVVQDVMLNLWHRRDCWKNVDDWEAYSIALVKNLSLDKLKRKGRSEASIEAVYEVNMKSDDSTPERNLEKKESQKLVEKIISQLPEKQRTMLILRDFDELSYKEIASRMGLTESQVKIGLFHARQKMKDLYLKIEQYGNQ